VLSAIYKSIYLNAFFLIFYKYKSHNEIKIFFPIQIPFICIFIKKPILDITLFTYNLFIRNDGRSKFYLFPESHDLNDIYRHQAEIALSKLYTKKWRAFFIFL
jgi:hypothetical protein